MARPTKYEEWMCDKVIDVMRDGGSIEEAAAEIGIAVSTFYEWKKDNKAFSEAVKEGEGLSAAWWKKTGRSAVMGAIPNFNATAWVFNMKNRFDWADKSDNRTEHSGEVAYKWLS